MKNIGNFVKSFGNGIISIQFKENINRDVLEKIKEMGFSASEVVFSSDQLVYALLDEGLPISILEARNIDDDEMKDIIQVVKNHGSEQFLKRVTLTKNYLDSLI